MQQLWILLPCLGLACSVCVVKVKSRTWSDITYSVTQMGLLGMSQRNGFVAVVFRCVNVSSHVGNTRSEFLQRDTPTELHTEMSALICEIKGFKSTLKANFPAVVCTKFASKPSWILTSRLLMFKKSLWCWHEHFCRFRFRFRLCLLGCCDAQRHGPNVSVVNLQVFLEAATLVSYSAY